MSDNLPLIPGKGTVCGDVRGVLRGVFRELGAPAPPAPLAALGAGTKRAYELPAIKDTHWCEKLSICESALRQEYARRIARSPQANLYRLCPARAASEPSERSECRPRLRRRHLAPGVRQHAAREASLWVRNMKCSSSGSLRPARAPALREPSPPHAPPPADDLTMCSFSIGSVRPPVQPPTASASQETPLPDYILCVPPCLEFVNFVVGHEHKQSVRLINLSKAELRLSVSPPARRELQVSVGARGQRVTAGAATQLHVSFTPTGVRALHEDLLVRVSAGRALVIPIACYIQPPVLDVLVPLEPTMSLSCTPELCAVSVPGAERAGPDAGGEVLDLGARLLGDVHRVPLLLHCHAKHAAFFMLSEDSWIGYTLDGITCSGALVCGPFSWSPAWWRGGGVARGAAWCRARRAGLQAAGLRLLSSAASVRPLCLLADSLLFRRDHITLQAHEKDYDICSDDDPACQYYVHLGTAFPGRGLSTTVQLINHSPVSYSFYWSVRPWGVCSCRGEECEGAVQRYSRELTQEASVAEQSQGGVRVEPSGGRAAPRSSCTLHVCAPDVGRRLGVQRATLMLILKDIPKESFPPGYDPMIISCQTVDSEPTPGCESEQREICEVVCCEMEVWWEVAPVRFVLDPPLIRLPHSRRVEAVRVTVRATQLFGRDPITADWRLPHSVPACALPAAVLTPAQSLATEFIVTLPSLPDQAIPHQKIDVIELVGAGEEWRSYCTVQREGARRALRLTPALHWLGVAAPGALLSTDLAVRNDTYQPVSWSCRPVRWCGAVSHSARCEGRPPCALCRMRGCSCALLWPTDGQLAHGDSEPIRFSVYAPKRDGCALILIAAQRAAAGDCGRAALIAFRVLAPRFVVRVLECAGNHKAGGICEHCALDARAACTGVLRPRGSLWRGRATCCRLRLTNLTPVPSTVSWEPPLKTDEPLQVTFLPNEFVVGAYEHMEIQVVLRAEHVCSRRVFIRRAHAEYSCSPLYMLIDTDIAGVEVTCEVPLSAGAETTGPSVLVRRTQKEVRKAVSIDGESAAKEDVFETFERQQIEYEKRFRCRCAFDSVTHPSPASIDRTVTYKKEPVCLQFQQLPIGTVRAHTLVLRNVSVLPARWAARVRRWPRQRVCTLAADKWAVDVRDPGIAIEVTPNHGVLKPGRGVEGRPEGESARVAVKVYADCGGLYHDQLLVQIEEVEPIVLDVWVEALGAPLAFAAAPQPGAAPVLWMSSADEERSVRARNATRSRLVVTAYLLQEHEDERDREPLRLYMRLVDKEPPPPSPLPSDVDLTWGVAGEVSSTSSSLYLEPATGVELSLFADHGRQCLTPYTVEPEICEVAAGADVCWRVARRDDFEDDLPMEGVLMLRCELLDPAGDNWYRPPPPPQAVPLRLARRTGRVQLSTKELRFKVCALSLPYNEVLRVRKRFQVLNVGDGPLSVAAFVRSPWTLVSEPQHAAPACGAGCRARLARDRAQELPLYLLPRSSTEVCVEVCIPRTAASPKLLEQTDPKAARYEITAETTSPFIVRDDEDVQAKMKLVLELEYPEVRVEPAVLVFGFVTDGDTRKGYFTVSHSSRTETLYLIVEWEGPEGFQLQPKYLRLPPGDSQRVYVQYTAEWCGAPVEGRAAVRARHFAWCASAVRVRAAPVRDHKYRAPPHDHTDDPVLLPPDCEHFC